MLISGINIVETEGVIVNDIPTVTNESYSTARLPHVHQQQSIQLSQNQTYVTSASVSNECYGTTTTSMDSDHLYATVEGGGGHNTTHASQEPKEEDYDYII